VQLVSRLPPVCWRLRQTLHDYRFEARRQLLPQITERSGLVVKLRRKRLLRRHAAER
jgi:hypothetical protein